MLLHVYIKQLYTVIYTSGNSTAFNVFKII